jgi:hypothetical protein
MTGELPECILSNISKNRLLNHSNRMLQLLQPALPHQLEDLLVPVEFLVDRAEVGVIFSTLDLVFPLLLVGLAIEAADGLGRGLGGSEVLFDVGLGLLKLFDLEPALLVDAFLLGELALLLLGGLLGRRLCWALVGLGGFGGVFGHELLHC